jgi:hypothetical protein
MGRVLAVLASLAAIAIGSWYAGGSELYAVLSNR